MVEITVALTLTDNELHDLSNQVQAAILESQMDGSQPSLMATMARRVIAAANDSHDDVPGPSAYEYVGKYFVMKNRAEHLEVQNALLMKAVEQMAHRGSLMQSALIEAGLAKLIPPPARLFDAQPVNGNS